MNLLFCWNQKFSIALSFTAICHFNCRRQRHRILPPAALSGSTVAAFDDVNVGDPDFVNIQCTDQTFFFSHIVSVLSRERLFNMLFKLVL